MVLDRPSHPVPFGRPDASSPSLGDYLDLMERFATGQMSADEFESQYLRMFKDDEVNWPEPVYQALNNLFLDVDAYYPDPAIRGRDGLDEQELRASVTATLATLRRAG